MGYRQVTCPVCRKTAEATTVDGHEQIAIHTPRDGSGRLCQGVGHLLAPPPLFLEDR